MGGQLFAFKFCEKAWDEIAEMQIAHGEEMQITHGEEMQITHREADIIFVNFFTPAQFQDFENLPEKSA